jgi:hypothetical protein
MDQLAFDVRRTILLAEYMRAWGMPLERTVTRKGDHTVEVYFFPAKGEEVVNRYATVGISGYLRSNGRVADHELFMVTPADDAGASNAEVVAFVFDIMAFSIRDDVSFEIGKIFDETPLAPKSWTARALLVDEPRAEPEYLSAIHVGSECVKLLWLMPIHKNEFESIKKSGIEVFDRAAEASEWSPADPGRPSFI